MKTLIKKIYNRYHFLVWSITGGLTVLTALTIASLSRESYEYAGEIPLPVFVAITWTMPFWAFVIAEALNLGVYLMNKTPDWKYGLKFGHLLAMATVFVSSAIVVGYAVATADVLRLFLGSVMLIFAPLALISYIIKDKRSTSQSESTK